MYSTPPVLGTWEVPGRPTASANTAFVALVPPWSGNQRRLRNYSANRDLGDAITHIEKTIYTSGATAHLIAWMRPLNFTWFTKAVAKNTAAIDNAGLFDDPGVYSTNYKYDGVLGTGTAVIADNAISTGDYVAYQLTDGTWILDLITSGTFGSSLTLTANTPNVTGGGIPVGSPLYFYGVVTDKDPATGQLPPQTNIAASQVRDATWTSGAGGAIVRALHPGDPLVFYSPNPTNQGWLEAAFGYHGKF